MANNYKKIQNWQIMLHCWSDRLTHIQLKINNNVSFEWKWFEIESDWRRHALVRRAPPNRTFQPFQSGRESFEFIIDCNFIRIKHCYIQHTLNGNSRARHFVVRNDPRLEYVLLLDILI